MRTSFASHDTRIRTTTGMHRRTPACGTRIRTNPCDRQADQRSTTAAAVGASRITTPQPEGHRGIHRPVSLVGCGKDRAVHLFERLAEAEAAIHAMPVERVHLHEVGALDSIIDIVGAVYGLEWLGATTSIVVAAERRRRHRAVRARHVSGARRPATVRLLDGVPDLRRRDRGRAGDADRGAARDRRTRGVRPVAGDARRSRSGTAPATRDFKGHPNVLRVLRRRDATDAGGASGSSSIECEIDDMNPQLFGPLMDRLTEAGALDVFYAAVQMKKNRPGTLVTVLAPPGQPRGARRRAVRAHDDDRRALSGDAARQARPRNATVETPLGAIRFKVATRDGRVLNAAAEFDDCARVAAERGCRSRTCRRSRSRRGSIQPTAEAR